jgi:predicted TPR repeat methyltransferase
MNAESDTSAPAAHLEMLRQAMQVHRDGRHDAARLLYQQVLEVDPRQADALHLMGVLEAELGDHERAAKLIGDAILVQPNEAMFHNNLGNVCMERGRFEEAKASYVRAIQADPDRPDTLNNLGVLLSRLGQPEDAEKLFKAVLSLAPEFRDARQNLANHYLRNGRLHDAVAQCVDGLIVTPRNARLHQILALAYSELGMKDEAVAVCRSWVQSEPDSPEAAYHLHACVGEQVPERAPDAYVKRVFDSFANSFDAKLAALSYKAPTLVADAVAQHAGPAAKSLDVLDAGCGTGLCGPLLAPWARTLVGVDLSEGMLRKAVARGDYTRLACGELVAFLSEQAAAYDVIVSADTLCYFGALEGFATAAFAALRGPGLLVFTVEAHPADDAAPGFRLQGNGRYSHAQAYVETTLREAGFALLDLAAIVPRSEAGRSVNGWLVCARVERGR